MAVPGDHDAAARSHRLGGDELRVRERSGERVSACRGRPRQVRGPARPERCELARVVRRLHGRGAGGDGAAVVTAYDAIVIGTGQAGPYVTSRLAGAGMKVAVIERHVFGGTCVNTGCIPTKAMVASAYAARMAARAAEYGVDVGPLRVDMKRVSARKAAISAQSRTGLEEWLRHMENCTVYQGHA